LRVDISSTDEGVKDVGPLRVGVGLGWRRVDERRRRCWSTVFHVGRTAEVSETIGAKESWESVYLGTTSVALAVQETRSSAPRPKGRRT
jgi:hypothetical protein